MRAGKPGTAKNPWTMARPVTAVQPVSHTYAETGFKGQDGRTAPDRLAPGMVQNITNGFPDGKGGIIGRKGFQGQFTTPLAGPIWNPISVWDEVDSQTRIFFASGGKLYSTQAGSATYEEVLISGSGASFAFPDDGEGVRLALYGQYLYGVEGGATGRVFRVYLGAGLDFEGAYIDTLDTVQSESSRLVLHPTQTCLLSGTYEWRVRAITSTTAAYPPTGTGATAGEAVAFTQQFVVQPSSTPVRGSKINAIALEFEQPAVTTGIDYYIIERRGGTLGSVDWRIVAIVQDGVNSSTTTFATASTTSGYIWDATTAAPFNTFYDMVKDTDLSGYSTTGSDPYQGVTINLGQYPPVGASDITNHAGRLCLAVQNTVWASWILDYEPTATDYGLVWTEVFDETLPGYLAQGTSFSIAGEGDADSIVCFSYAQGDANASDYGSLLIAFRQNSHTFISGDNPANFAARPSRVGEYYGCLSPRAVANIDGQWVYQSPKGVQILTTSGPPKLLGEVDGQWPMENQLSQTAIMEPTGYRRISYLYFNRQLWAFAPVPQDPTNYYAYTWDARTDGWATQISSIGNGFTGGVVASGQNDTGATYLAGTDGQLYKYGDTGDKEDPASGVDPVNFALVTARHGQRGESGTSPFSLARPTRFMVDVDADTLTLAWAIRNESNIATSGTYTVGNTREAVEITAISDVRGLFHQVELSIAGVGETTRIAGYALTTTEQNIKRA